MFGLHNKDKEQPEKTKGTVAKAVGGAVLFTAALGGGEAPVIGTEILPTRSPDVPIERLVEEPVTVLPEKPSDMVMGLEPVEPTQPGPVLTDEALLNAAQEAAARVVDGTTGAEGAEEVVNSVPRVTPVLIAPVSITAAPIAEPELDVNTTVLEPIDGQVVVEQPSVVDSGTPAGFPDPDAELTSDADVVVLEDGTLVHPEPPPAPPAA